LQPRSATFEIISDSMRTQPGRHAGTSLQLRRLRPSVGLGDSLICVIFSEQTRVSRGAGYSENPFANVGMLSSSPPPPPRLPDDPPPPDPGPDALGIQGALFS